MKWLRYLVAALPVGLRVLRNWPRLEKEGLEAIHAAVETAQAARLNVLSGTLAALLASEDLKNALIEIAEAVAVIEEILDVRGT